MSFETLANITLYATTMLWRRSTMVMSGRQIGYRLPILSRYAEWDDLTIRLLECLFTITIHSFQHYSYVTANYMYVNYVMFRYPYTWCSRVFQSCLFHPWNFGPVFSGPAISTHAILSHVFQSRVFHSRVFSRSPQPWSLAWGYAPVRLWYLPPRLIWNFHDFQLLKPTFLYHNVKILF